MTELEKFQVRLLEIVPELDAAHAEVTVDWIPEHPPPTLWMIDMGEALAEHWEKISDDRMRQVFALVEEALTTGSEFLGNAVATGMLEALASEVSGGRLPQALLDAKMGPAASAYMKAWDEFTLS
jgi:hypothetical protein